MFSIINPEVDGYYCEFRTPPNSKLSFDELLAEKVETVLENYNEGSERQRITLLLYKEFYKHLFKILRAITVHDGHLIIVGMKGFGISKLIQLACFVANIQHNQMELHSSYSDEEWRTDLRRNIIYSATEDKQIAYICNEYRLTNKDWYLDLECLVKSNICSEITRGNDIKTALISIRIQQMKAKKSLEGISMADSKKKGKEDEVDDQYNLEVTKQHREAINANPRLKNELYYSFLRRVRKNFKLIFNFTPSGYGFREKMERHKNLMINSQMMWIQNLQYVDLVGIGKKAFLEKQIEKIEKMPRQINLADQEFEFMKKKEVEMNTKVLHALSGMYLETQTIAKQYIDEASHKIYFTPVSFIRSFKVYAQLLEERRQKVIDIQKRYEEGMAKIKETMETVKYYMNTLKKNTPGLIEKQKKLVGHLVDIEEEFQKVRLQRERFKSEEVDAISRTEEAKIMMDDAQEALDKIVPCINEALNSMTQISKVDLSEIRTFSKPPKTIKLVLKAVCLMLGVQPIVKKKSNGVYKPSYWMAAISSELLGDPTLPERLVNYDKSQLTQELMAQVEDILSEANYSYENAHKASKASAGVFKWVKAMRDYYYIFQDLQPRRDALLLAQKQFDEQQSQLRNKQRQIKDTENALEGLIKHQETKQKSIDELKAEIDDSILKKRRAETLLKALNSEQQKWLVCMRILDNKFDTVQGDVLLSACYITIAGAFNQKYRLKLVQKWQASIRNQGLHCAENFSFQELFGDNFKMRQWHQNLLPPDAFSTDNALIMNKTKRYKLLIDPQQIAWTWIRKQYLGTGMITTKLTEPNYKRTLEIAIDMGKLLLIENVTETLDVHIESLMRREITNYGNQKMLKFCRKPVKYDPNFDMIVQTNLAKPRFDPNITNHACLVNFYMTTEGLTQNLLSIIVANERPDLEKSFTENSNAAFENIKNLRETENKILKNLTTNVQKLLKDEKMIEILKESKICAETIAEKLKRINTTSKFLAKARAIYAPVAIRAANLYFSTTELYKINPMYQYSMKWFFNLFNKTLEKTNQLVSGKDVIIEDEDFKLLNHKFSADDRINILTKTLTQEVIRKVTYSAFQDDRQTITYYIALHVLKGEEQIHPELFAFSLQGSKKIDLDVRSPGSQINCPWIDDLMWAELKSLEAIQPFNKRNLTQHIKQNAQLWNKLYGLRQIAYSDLPNRDMLDIRQYCQVIHGELPASQLQKYHDDPDDPDHEAKIIDLREEDEDVESIGNKPQQTLTKEQGKLSQPSILSKPKDENQAVDMQNLPNASKQMSKNMQFATKSQATLGANFINERISIKSKNDETSSKHSMTDDDRMTRSRATSKRKADTSDGNKFYTEAEILADDDLWKVTDSSEDEEEVKENLITSPRSPKPLDFIKEVDAKKAIDPREAIKNKNSNLYGEKIRYDPNDRNKDYYENTEQTKDELENMARYLVEVAPQDEYSLKGIQKEEYTEMQRKSKSERKTIGRREYLTKCQVELALMRCIRPDLVQACLHKIVETIYDFNYHSFEVDVLSQFVDPDGTLVLRRIKNASSIQSGGRKNNASHYVPPSRKAKTNMIQQLIQEAHNESSVLTPIFFLVTHSVDVFAELTEYYNRTKQNVHGIKIHHVSVGRSAGNQIEDILNKALLGGDWVLIENLHLAEDWVNELELLIAKLDPEQAGKTFRIFMSAVQMDNCPQVILTQSVKVSLQQPNGVKIRMEKFAEDLQKTRPVWTAGSNALEYKNLFFSLSYLHSVLECRKAYGTLGWNIYKGFDQSDFQISLQQIKQYFEGDVEDKEASISMIKYLFSNVNFSGKMSREEDQRKLNAIIQDLVSSNLVNCQKAPQDLDRGHYGFPKLSETSFFDWAVESLPDADDSEIFGFNQNIHRSMLTKRGKKIINAIYELNKKSLKALTREYHELEKDLENKATKISVAKSSLHHQTEALINIKSKSKLNQVESERKLLTDDSHAASSFFNLSSVDMDSLDNLLPLFVMMQKVLKLSSLAQNIELDCDRFDENVDSKILPARDQNDRKLAEIARQVINILQNNINERHVDQVLPYSLSSPEINIYALEIKQYLYLFKFMRKSVENLLEHIEGKYMKPLDIERLWQQVEQNLVPKVWKKHAFQTAFTSFADFIIELVQKAKFWTTLLKNDGKVASLWLPAFYDPNQFLNSLIQKKCRKEKVPLRLMKNIFEVTRVMNPNSDNCPALPDTTYVHGLWLEGASWNHIKQILVEPKSSILFEEFPVIKVTTVRKSTQELQDDDASDFDDNPVLTELDQQRLQEEGIRLAKKDSDDDVNKANNASYYMHGNAKGSQIFSKKKKQSGVLASEKGSSYNFKVGSVNTPKQSGNLQHVQRKQTSGLPKDLVNRTNSITERRAQEDHENEDSFEYDQESIGSQQRQGLYFYKCPVYRTTIRLNTGEISSENKPVFYIKLPTMIHPRKWVKRSVALLMETGR